MIKLDAPISSKTTTLSPGPKPEDRTTPTSEGRTSPAVPRTRVHMTTREVEQRRTAKWATRALNGRKAQPLALTRQSATPTTSTLRAPSITKTITETNSRTTTTTVHTRKDRACEEAAVAAALSMSEKGTTGVAGRATRPSSPSQIDSHSRHTTSIEVEAMALLSGSTSRSQTMCSRTSLIAPHRSSQDSRAATPPSTTAKIPLRAVTAEQPHMGRPQISANSSHLSSSSSISTNTLTGSKHSCLCTLMYPATTAAPVASPPVASQAAPSSLPARQPSNPARWRHQRRPSQATRAIPL